MNALRVAVAVCLLCGVSWTGAAEVGGTFESLRARAAALASLAPAPARGEVPEWLRRLTYDDLRRITFDGRRSLWLNEGPAFAVQFLHPGFLFDRSVRVNEVAGGVTRPLPFRSDYFRYERIEPGEIPPGMGFAGFRLMYPWGGRGQPPATSFTRTERSNRKPG
jgi:glucans biosynthesis protein